MQLIHGRIGIWDQTGRRLLVTPGMGLMSGDVVYLHPGARAHLVLPYEDHLDVAGEGWLRITESDTGTGIELWQGKVVVQVLPDLLSKRKALTIHTHTGRLSLSTGHVGVATQEEGKVELVSFNGQAHWEGRLVVEGESWIVQNGQVARKDLMTPKKVLEWRASVSTLVPVLREALTLYRSGNKDAAAERFSAIQAAFPESAVAAFFLGQIALERGDLVTGIHQWRLYARLDPKGAKRRRVHQYLTALIVKGMKHEIRSILKQEDALRQAVVEPNTLAVVPILPRDASGAVPGEKWRRIGKALTALMIDDLQGVPGLRLLERLKVERLVDELNLASSGLTDPNRSARVGRLLRAERVLVGSYRLQEDRP